MSALEKGLAALIITLLRKEKSTSVEESPSQHAILGRYVLNHAIFDELEETKEDIRGEIELTDAIMSLSTKYKIYAHNFVGERHDIGSREGFVKATINIALSNPITREGVLKHMKEQLKLAKY